ncbi:MAG: TPR end-of-group domain-containing protein, partial [bacterium]
MIAAARMLGAALLAGFLSVTLVSNATLAMATPIEFPSAQATPPASTAPKSRSAESSPSADDAKNATSDAALDAALRARDFTAIDRIVNARVDKGDRDPILLYNGACALAQLGRHDAAEKRLLEAVKAGFRDFETLESDPDLEPIRASQTYEAIMEARERVERSGGPRARPVRVAKPDPLAAWQKEHGDDYRYERDPDRGLVYATFLEESSHARMKEILDELGAHLLKSYFDKPPEDPVLVAIVRPQDARKYLDREEVKGMYLHDARRLVARDTGQSLQHEFVHLLHFAHMERTGQRHPIWIQEGLASLYENYTVRADGSFEFIPNIRFNI